MYILCIDLLMLNHHCNYQKKKKNNNNKDIIILLKSLFLKIIFMSVADIRDHVNYLDRKVDKKKD